jgi:hypothetical protein
VKFQSRTFAFLAPHSSPKSKHLSRNITNNAQ